MPITWGSTGVFGSIGKAVKEANADSVSPSSIQSAAKSFVQNYITYNFRYLAQLAFQSFNDLFWEGLVAKMVEDGQTVNANAVDSGSIAIDGAGTLHIHDANGVDGFVTATQMLLNDDTIKLTCTSASAGADTWQVDSVQRGRVSGTATTGTLYGEELTDSDKCGLSFTIQEPVNIITGDTGGLLTSAAITGGEKLTNCDADGKVYLDINEDGYGNYTLTGYAAAAGLISHADSVFHVDYATTGAKTITADNGSGLAGTVTVATLGTSESIVMTLKIPYAVGDEITIGESAVTEDGVFQTWFRDTFSKCLPSSHAPTISDELAGGLTES